MDLPAELTEGSAAKIVPVPVDTAGGIPAAASAAGGLVRVADNCYWVRNGNSSIEVCGNSVRYCVRNGSALTCS